MKVVGQFQAFCDASDIDATRAAYVDYSPDGCDCSYCRNLRAQPDQIPSWFRAVLVWMGIDSYKPVEIIHYCRLTSGTHSYSVEWAFIGVQGSTIVDQLVITNEGRRTWIYSGGIPDDGFKSEARRCSISILLDDVPWTLDEAESS